ncbi:ATP-binding cassette sub-family A member 1-like [Elysia marginata]|uniref:ATP-binding cassette sub-family A member 1-like n=1 Tax=Elysia marginata TaxID=1093978 RepID=A0AAV4JIM7_9GAST|nr:ATP-binding cassette sub-family A member 1-like [Elysia marginata]
MGDKDSVRRLLALDAHPQASRTFDLIENVFTLVSDFKQVLQRLIKLHTDAKNAQEIAIIRCNMLFGNNSVCDSVKDLLQTLNKSHNFLTNLHSIATKILVYTDCLRVERFVAQPNVEALLKESDKQRKHDRFWAAIVFDNIEYNAEEMPTLIKYTLRMDPHRTEETLMIRDWLWTLSDKAAPKNTKELVFGFAFIQDMIDHAIIRLHTNVSHEPGLYMQPFPFPGFLRDEFLQKTLFALPLVMVISWTFSISLVVGGIVYEKESRLKETLKIMGLGNGVNWLAWFISSLLPMMLTAVLLCILLKFGRILTYSDATLVFAYMCAFITSIVSFAFFMSTFFNKASLGAVWSALCFIVTYVPDLAITLHVQDGDMALGEKLAMVYNS